MKKCGVMELNKTCATCAWYEDYQGEDENGNECVCVLGVVTYWEREGRYVLADENGFCNDWTLEDEAQPENWPHLIHCGTVFDEEVSR